jgi:hypothetical protein
MDQSVRDLDPEIKSNGLTISESKSLVLEDSE